MAPKAKSAKLTSLTVTQEEIQRATDIIAAADKKKMASLKAGMKHFCIANPDDSMEKKDKGLMDEKLRNFVIHQFRAKDTDKTTTTDHQYTKATAKVKQYHWWSEEVMNRKIGAEKAQDWRDSGKIAWRPDRVTQKTDKHAIEWATPIEFESITEDELERIRMRALEEIEDDSTAALDLETLKGYIHGPQAPSSSGGTATELAVPEEPSELDKLTARIVEFKKNIKVTFEKFQRLEMETKLIKKYAENPSQAKCPYHVTLASDCGKQIKNVEKLVKLLEQMVVEEFADEQLPRILQKIDAAEMLSETILFWAARCGYESSQPAPKKKPRGGKAAST